MRYAFVDGDIIAFKASSAVQKDIDWGGRSLDLSC